MRVARIAVRGLRPRRQVCTTEGTVFSTSFFQVASCLRAILEASTYGLSAERSPLLQAVEIRRRR